MCALAVLSRTNHIPVKNFSLRSKCHGACAHNDIHDALSEAVRWHQTTHEFDVPSVVARALNDRQNDRSDQHKRTGKDVEQEHGVLCRGALLKQKTRHVIEWNHGQTVHDDAQKHAARVLADQGVDGPHAKDQKAQQTHHHVVAEVPGRKPHTDQTNERSASNWTEINTRLPQPALSLCCATDQT